MDLKNTMMSQNTSDRTMVNNFIFIPIFIIFICNKTILKGKKTIDSQFSIMITYGGKKEVKIR